MTISGWELVWGVGISLLCALPMVSVAYRGGRRAGRTAGRAEERKLASDDAKYQSKTWHDVVDGYNARIKLAKAILDGRFDEVGLADGSGTANRSAGSSGSGGGYAAVSAGSAPVTKTIRVRL